MTSCFVSRAVTTWFSDGTIRSVARERCAGPGIRPRCAARCALGTEIYSRWVWTTRYEWHRWVITHTRRTPSLNLKRSRGASGAIRPGIEAAVVTNESLVLVHIGTCLTIAAEVVVDGEPFCVGVRPDGREVAVGCKDGKVRLFAVGSDSSSLTPGAVLERHRGEVTGCKYSPDGSRLATCDGNREVLVWDPEAGTVAVDKMVFHRARVTCVGWSADGVRLATGVAGRPDHRVGHR